MITQLGTLLLLLLGGLMLLGAVLDWDRLRRDWRSQELIELVGTSGTRILQGLMGLLLALAGLLALLGFFD